MPSLKKVDYVNELVILLREHPNFAIVDFDSIPHKSLEELKNNLRQASDTRLQVVKNSLFEVALLRITRGQRVFSDQDTQQLRKKALTGQSAVLFLSSDWLAGLQNFFKSAKTFEGIVFKGGVLEDKVYFRDKLDTLASLPSREVLMAKILRSLRLPQYSLVRSLKWDAGRFVRVLTGLKDKQS
ncbi:50S ribosomal protein L10 [Candidatus Roizmanbacteria bacterium RIFCSPHIGHO2_01_FULL_39_12b]|uniref:Large ribosomal subunit protein uL10 n=1 Tax=Candidatus Roizmanbacteria bacterium RIFCSPHIGHO2_01_FULL_39_12b TaxID=1802030 RepID=A0A1F7GAD9_9BACT|nr:MAG: 50S ribosomal protein L10 [Candidatus Roizmanbacteria bacterium RIFCSPHIGHO2_01_FULL_39_12b]